MLRSSSLHHKTGLKLPDISALNGTAIANIAKVNGLDLPSGALTPPLDSYSGAAAGFSVRLLRTAYTGAALRVRRDTGGATGDDDEADIAFDSGLVSLNSTISNASSGVTATTLGQFINVGTVGGTTYTNPDSLTVTALCYVPKMYDQSGNSRDATASGAGTEMQLHDGTLDTDLVQLNGTVAMESNRVVYSFSSATASNTFAVTTVAESGLASGLSTLYGNPFGNNAITFQGSNVLAVLAASTTAMNATYPNNQMAILVYGTGSGYYVRVDGTAETNNTETTALNLDNFGGPSYGIWRGKVQEFIVWGSFSTSDISGLENNFSDFYSIPGM